MSTRRTFITSLAAAAGMFAYDPERTLYVPGRKCISVPSGKVFIPQLRCVLFVNGAAEDHPVIPSGNARPLHELFDELCGESMSWGVRRDDPATVVFREKRRKA